jgi:hypothetical protein
MIGEMRPAKRATDREKIACTPDIVLSAQADGFAIVHRVITNK